MTHKNELRRAYEAAYEMYNAAQSSSPDDMAKDFESWYATQSVPHDWRMLPEDLWTHLCDWRTACAYMLSNAPPPTYDADEPAYWKRQLATLARIEAEVRAYDEFVTTQACLKGVDP